MCTLICCGQGVIGYLNFVKNFFLFLSLMCLLVFGPVYTVVLRRSVGDVVDTVLRFGVGDVVSTVLPVLNELPRNNHGYKNGGED